MISKIYNIQNYQPRQEESFLFDTNIWMYLFCPLGNYKARIIQNYSNFLKRIIIANSTISLPSIIVSEFFNAYLRLEFNILKTMEPDIFVDFKKDYRGTNRYKETIENIARIIKNNILRMAVKINDEFAIMEMNDLFRNISDHDYNDKFLIQLAERDGLKIVTNDADFSYVQNVEIFTSNPIMLHQ